MLIKSIEIKNFRSIRDQCLDCNDLTILVGRNGSGKSSFLKAIEFFYDVDAPISQEDFFDRDVDTPIEIRVVYTNLREDEKNEFQAYIKDDILIVTKRISYENSRIVQRYYGAVLQLPIFAGIRTIPGKRERVNAWNKLVEDSELINFEDKARSADDVDRLMNEYEVKHPELMEAIEREEQFFGPKNIGGGKLDKYTKYVLVPAVREASDETSGKKGAIYQLLDMIVLRKINTRKDILEFKQEIKEKVKKLYSSENLFELSELGVSISETLKKFAPGSQLNLKWDEPKPPEVPLPAAKATLIEDDFEGDVNRKGHGLQRALILTLLQHLAVIIPEEPYIEESNNIDDIHERKTVEKMLGPDLILAIEEPELYLHPSRCRYLAEVLLQLAEMQGIGLGSRNQIIYTTHSPYFVDLYRFDKIRIVRKSTSPDFVVLQSIVSNFTIQQVVDELEKICNANGFTKNSFLAHSINIMNLIVNEGFFADVVVVVEGQTEVGVFWKLQDIMNKKWSQLGVAIVPAGGKNNIDRPTIIFRGFKIPTYFIFDADSHLTNREKRENAMQCNNRYLNLAGVPVMDFPDTQVHETWSVFKENIEKDIKGELGDKIFITIRDEIAYELGYDEPKDALKNIEGAARFIERVYKEGKRLLTLEQIVENITKMAMSLRAVIKIEAPQNGN